ncbi:hypothetical protein GGS20DRAFT_459165 [Poronia punctata]|nr:hypothetical protein GGS20DRAFT_459165 [Poronia punctata]
MLCFQEKWDYTQPVVRDQEQWDGLAREWPMLGARGRHVCTMRRKSCLLGVGRQMLTWESASPSSLTTAWTKIGNRDRESLALLPNRSAVFWCRIRLSANGNYLSAPRLDTLRTCYSPDLAGGPLAGLSEDYEDDPTIYQRGAILLTN